MNASVKLLVPGLAMALLLAGCGGNGSSPTDTATEDMGTDLSDAADTAVEPTPDVTPEVTPDPAPDSTSDPAVDTSTGGIVGDSCYSSTDCSEVPGAGRLCMNTIGGILSFPGGYCSAVCTSSADCGAGAACVDLYGINNYCLKECSAPSDCRISEGYDCTTLPSVTGGPYCAPPSPDPESTTDY
ncbi:MAG: hypothetical protein JRG91_00255 [Deltaproteobacteria bacterium]|nr:hypothetical protein [Deltaproteobacteria bacterium]